MLGQRFGRLIVSRSASKNKRGRKCWQCLCDCGKIKIIEQSHLISGDTRSCGCLLRDITTKRNITHGLRKVPEYNVWNKMVRRCEKADDPSYVNYGARGISVCDRWRNSFLYFYEDMGPRPSINHTIERIDNSGNYDASNCKWATRKEQGRNKRNNIWLTHNGETRILAEWAEITGISSDTLKYRLNHNWTVIQTLTTPLCTGGRR